MKISRKMALILLILPVILPWKAYAAKKARLELRLEPQQAVHIKTRHVTEFVTRQKEHDITVRRKQQTEMDYGVECVKHTKEKEMLFNKTLMSLAFVHQEDAGEGEYKTVREYDSKTGEKKEDALVNPFIFTLGSRIFVRVDGEGNLLGSGGAQQAAALILEAMHGPGASEKMPGQLAYYAETLGRIPAFLAYYPGKMAQGQTWEAPYYHSRTKDLWSQNWHWQIEEIEKDSLKVVGRTEGEEKFTQSGGDSVIEQNFKTEITAKLFIDRETGIILHGDILEKKNGTVVRVESKGDGSESQKQVIATVEIHSAGTIETRILEDED